MGARRLFRKIGSLLQKYLVIRGGKIRGYAGLPSEAMGWLAAAVPSPRRQKPP